MFAPPDSHVYPLFAVTNDSDINDIYGKGGSHAGQTPHQGASGSGNTSFGGNEWHYVYMLVSIPKSVFACSVLGNLILFMHVL